MSQPPPPPGNPPRFGKPDGAVPPPPAQGPPLPPPGPPAGYGYPAPPAPAQAGTAPAPAAPPAGNPYAAPVPPGQNPYAAPAQPAYPHTPYPQAQFPQGAPPPPYAGGGQPAPGYGYPAQQPPPPPGQGYGPQAPPAYGYGQAPPPGGYQQYQGAPAGRANGRLTVIVAAVVVGVLVIAGGVFLATRGGGGSHPQPQASSGAPSGGTGTPKAAGPVNLAFKYDAAADTVAPKDNLKDTLGMWFTDKYVVKNEIGKVVAYDLKSGAPAWTLAAPSGGHCTAARDTYNDIAAVQYGALCEKVMAIDLTKGTELWSASLPGAAQATRTGFIFTQMAISGDAVGVDWLSGSIAYRLSDQKVLWQSGDGTCRDDGYAGGKQFVGVVNCGYTTYKVQVIDPANNGSAKWSWTAPTGTQVSAIVSTDPVVVLLGTQSQQYTDVAVLDNGRLKSRISLGTDKYHIDDDGTDQQSVHNVLVSSDTVYLSLNGRTDGNGDVLSGIVAFSLADGKQKWVAKPGDKQDITGLDFDNGKVLAYQPPGYDTQGKLVTLDPATGAMTPFATLAQDAYSHLDLAGMHAYPVWHNGIFLIADNTVYATTSVQKYLICYG